MSKYLTYEDRMNIALGLKEQLSFTVISDSLCKDRTAIAKEVKKHAIPLRRGTASAFGMFSGTSQEHHPEAQAPQKVT